MPQWRDGAAGLCIATLQGHEGIVRSVAALEGGLLASGSFDHTVKVWEKHTKPNVKNIIPEPDQKHPKPKVCAGRRIAR